VNTPSLLAQTRKINLAVLSWLRLARVAQKVDRISTCTLRSHDLSLAQFDVLVRVHTQEGLTQRELASALLVTKGNVCQLLDRMEQSHLLERRPEGRTNRIYLTERGIQMLESALPAQEASISRLFSALNAQEQATLLRLLRKLDRSLDEAMVPGDCRGEEQFND
jgi:DNA-binding MarR family transcriptional regulator